MVMVYLRCGNITVRGSTGSHLFIVLPVTLLYELGNPKARTRLRLAYDGIRPDESGDGRKLMIRVAETRNHLSDTTTLVATVTSKEYSYGKQPHL